MASPSTSKVDCRRGLADTAFVADDGDYHISVYAEYWICA
jgi:hypothetical protein